MQNKLQITADQEFYWSCKRLKENYAKCGFDIFKLFHVIS